MDACILRGVRTHNLKGIDLTIPFGLLTVVTGVSGSGKSSLVFDTVYAEGQRRFVDCMATYARQFLERLERPDAAFIGRLEPPIALKQTVAVRNARSTVGSMSEIADHLALLFAHAGEPHCLSCGTPIEPETVETAVARILASPPAERFCIAAPAARDRLGSEGIRDLIRQGYVRTLHDGAVREWPDAWLGSTSSSALPGEIVIVVDRFTAAGLRRGRLVEAIEAAWRLGKGRALLYEIPAGAGGTAGAAGAAGATGARDEGATSAAGAAVPTGEIRRGSFCRSCGSTGEIPSPSLFSANNALGACPSCQGFGRTVIIDPDKIVPDPRRSLVNDAIVPFRMPSRRGWHRRMMRAAPDAGVRTETAWSDLTDQERRWVFEGDRRFPGVSGLFRKLDRKRYKMHIRIFLARFRGYVPCAACRGTRLTPAALAVTIGGRNLADLNEAPISELRSFLDRLRLAESREARVRAVIGEIRSRLRCLDEVGLGYLTLGRTARTLSGGETQRLRLASGMGSALTRALYVLDEPTVGLHARDAARVSGVLRRICHAGNTVLVIEHDPAVVEGADHLIVLGPEGGERGGELLYEGPPADFLREKPGFFRIQERRSDASPEEVPRLSLEGLAANNLRIDALEIPLSGITAVSGVSGSGKSSLVDQVIFRNWRRFQGLPVEDVGALRSASGFEALEEVLLIGQEPLGRSTRSNAVSFVKVLPILRALLAGTPAARARRLKPRDFSFNVAGGRCEMCKGLGTIILEMHFLPDVEVSCEACRGRRFRNEVLEVSFGGRNILGILQMTADEAAVAFGTLPEVVRRLRPLQEVGLGYLRLGQATSTLSGGEAQRLKLASFLAEGTHRGRRLILFDEPTTGLHARDVARLLLALRALAARGDAILVVEHHMDFLAASDWIIDLGPGPGAAGGRVVYEGNVDGLVRCRKSLTGRALAAHLSPSRAARSRGGAPARAREVP